MTAPHVMVPDRQLGRYRLFPVADLDGIVLASYFYTPAAFICQKWKKIKINGDLRPGNVFLQHCIISYWIMILNQNFNFKRNEWITSSELFYHCSKILLLVSSPPRQSKKIVKVKSGRGVNLSPERRNLYWNHRQQKEQEHSKLVQFLHEPEGASAFQAWQSNH